MTRRNIVFLIPLVLMILLAIATAFISDWQVRKFLLLSVVITALVVIVVYIFVTHADLERVREDYDMKINRLERLCEVERQQIWRAMRLIDEERMQIRKKVFSDATVRSTDIDDAEFASLVNRLLTGGGSG